MLRRLTYSFALVFIAPLAVHAQGGAMELDTFTVSGSQFLQSASSQSVSSVRIQRRLAEDLGKIIQLFPGIQVKSYGGLGGMKTVSFRSLGAGHTSIVYDRFTRSQTQSGQTDIGQIPVDFISRVELVHQAGTSIDYPIQAKLAGQIIAVHSRHTENNRKAALSAGSQAGSFGQAGGHLFAAIPVGKWQFSASGKARTFNGSYPFSYRNGQTEIKTKRRNGDLHDYYGTLTATCAMSKKHSVQVMYNGATYDKGLPGAVIFYNDAAGQRLWGNSHSSSFFHVFRGARIEGATSASYQFSTLDYVDPNYLNSAGFLHSVYAARESGLQSQWSWSSPSGLLKFCGGAGIRYESLHSSSFGSVPKRFSTDGLLAFQWSRPGIISGQLGAQDVHDIRPSSSVHRLVLLPSVEWKRQLGKHFGWSVSYRYTVRQPSFNELYYNQIGNQSLRPEKAHLSGVRFFYAFHPGKDHKQWLFEGGLQPGYTRATDKILAIPTKNLFVWSIQNIGKSQAYTAELQQRILRRFRTFTASLHLQYTLQYAEDITDRNSPVYGHLLSYSPLHSGTAELDLFTRNSGFSILFTYQGERYALNQNIPANLLSDFFLIDASLHHKFRWQKQDLTIRVAINNITNNYYSYIRYFIMPGINWAVNLSWNINSNAL